VSSSSSEFVHLDAAFDAALLLFRPAGEPSFTSSSKISMPPMSSANQHRWDACYVPIAFSYLAHKRILQAIFSLENALWEEDLPEQELRRNHDHKL
jgi:hypothetical protein